MRILIASATAAEVAPFSDALGGGANGATASRGVRRQADGRQNRTRVYEHHRHELHLLVTGVGMVATAAWCSQALTAIRYDLALNLGVCGAFDPTLEPGTVVHVVCDRIAELGAEDGERLLTIEDLGLVDGDDRPYGRAELRNPSPPVNAVLAQLPRVSAITVNTIHGREESIATVVDRFHPQVESMEGAAFMYASLMHGVPFAQIRAVSNVVERRNRSAWRLDDAIEALGATALGIIEAA